MNTTRPGVVIDNGSFCCKAGFSCDNHPVAIFRTVVGRPKDRIGFYGRTPYDVYIGDEAESHINDYDLHSPVVCGKITHWDNMERVWHHIYYRELKVAPEAQNVVLALSTTTSIQDKVKCCEIFFENLNAPAMSIQAQSVAALYGSGFTTGLSVDLGYDTTEVNAIYEGGNIAYAQMETNISGHDISKYIKSSLIEKGIDLGDKADEIVTHLKRDVFHILPPGDETCYKMKHVLPDGRVIDISREIHCASELLFNPRNVLGDDTKVLSLHDAVITCARKCDADLQDELFSAVVPTGGLSATAGLTKKLQYEMENVLDKPVNVIDSDEIYCVAWLGAAIFAGMQDVEKVWVKKKQFEEYGEKIVRNKFI